MPVPVNYPPEAQLQAAIDLMERRFGEPRMGALNNNNTYGNNGSSQFQG